jgi:hypothetical protein
LTLHDLRRTFATNLAGLGVAPHVIERLLTMYRPAVSKGFRMICETFAVTKPLPRGGAFLLRIGICISKIPRFEQKEARMLRLGKPETRKRGITTTSRWRQSEGG